MSMTLKSFEVWYRGEFQFYARSKSEKQLRHTLWFKRGWRKSDIDLRLSDLEKG